MQGNGISQERQTDLLKLVDEIASSEFLAATTSFEKADAILHPSKLALLPTAPIDVAEMDSEVREEYLFVARGVRNAIIDTSI